VGWKCDAVYVRFDERDRSDVALCVAAKPARGIINHPLACIAISPFYRRMTEAKGGGKAKRGGKAKWNARKRNGEVAPHEGRSDGGGENGGLNEA